MLFFEALEDIHTVTLRFSFVLVGHIFMIRQ